MFSSQTGTACAELCTFLNTTELEFQGNLLFRKAAKNAKEGAFTDPTVG